MTKHKREFPKEHPLQWHPANYAGLQIELAEEKEFLHFEDEHQLPLSAKIAATLSRRTRLHNSKNRKWNLLSAW